MRQEIEAFYGKLLKRMHPRPGVAGAQRFHPLTIAGPDLLADKKRGGTLDIEDAAINDGLHFHAVLVASERSRLGRDVAVDINENQSYHLGRFGKTRRVHALTVARTEYDFAGYSLKHVANDRTPDRMAMDDIWIFPIDKSELTPSAEYRRSRGAP